MADTTLEKARKAAEKAGLGGELTRGDDGVIVQEGYGPWPVCTICKEQTEPTGYSEHVKTHIQV